MNYKAKAKEFFAYHGPKLNVELSAMVNSVSHKNGFELYRLVCHEVDAVLNNSGFQVQIEIHQKATEKCKNLTETVACAKWIEIKGK